MLGKLYKGQHYKINEGKQPSTDYILLKIREYQNFQNLELCL